MAKQALQRVLEYTIGKYVNGLDAESLNVAIWSGKIALNSVELNVDAVNLELDRQAEEAPNLALPFKVVSGGFTSFHVEVPWSHLASSPVILRLSGLSIIVEPYNRETNESVSIAHAQKERQSSIKSSNDYREQANAVKKLAGAESDSSNQSSFASRLVRRIIENIQVEISDVNISLAGKEGSAGVVLESLSLVTTDKDGKRTFVDRTANSNSSIFLYKALELKGFGVYVDESIPGEPQSHAYVLAPLAFQANLRQADGNVCIDHSKYKLSSELSTVSIEVSHNQLDVVDKVSQSIATRGDRANPLFPEYRPAARVSSKNAHEWWKYAKRCIGRMSGRSSWAEFFRAFKKRKTYIQLYKRHAHSETCSWIEPLSVSEYSVLTDMENDRTISVNGLMVWRDLADGQVALEQSKRTKNEKGKKKGLFAVFSSERKEENDDPPVQLTSEELKELEDMSQQSFADDELSKDSKLCDASFILKSLNIVLTSYQSRQIAALNMGVVDLGLDARADGALAFNFDMLDLKIHDLATSDSLFPDVLRSLPKDDAVATEEKKGAVHLQIDKSSTGDQSLKLNIAAFEAVASPTFFKELISFATLTPTTTTKKVKSASLQSASESVDDISNALVDAWKVKTESKVSWAMDVDIDAPIIMVPEACNNTRAKILVLDLGQFHFTFGPFSANKEVEQWFQDNKVNHQAGVSYESGSLCTSDFSFKVGTASDWLERSNFEGSIVGSDIVEPISAKLDFGIEQSHNAHDPPRICCIGVAADPTLVTLNFSMQKNADGVTEVELRAAATRDVEFFLSMHDAATLGVIVGSLTSSLEVSETRNEDSQTRELSANEADRIEQLSSALEQRDSKSPSMQSSSISQVGTDEAPFQLRSDVEMKIAQKIQTKITMPQFRITVVNDLQGLDEPLSRISVAKFVVVGEVAVPVGPNATQIMTVDFHMNTSIIADYFDSSINLWSSLLVKPWEVTLKITRSSTRRFESPRLSSEIDLETSDCHVSLSPDFLASLASAARMWSVYSTVTSKSLIADDEKDENTKKSTAAIAARHLLTSLPYAIENHCGSDVVFSLPHGSVSRRECPTGSIQYFRFQQPQEKGHGGRRVYGQDVEFEKSVALSIGDFEVVIPHLDAMLGSRKEVHNLPDGRVLVTFVVREDRRMVLHLTSNVSIVNHSSIPFAISIGMDDPKGIGTCVANNEEKANTALTVTDGIATKQSNRYSVPMDSLTTFSKEWADSGQSSVFLRLSPKLKSDSSQVLSGGLDIASPFGELSQSESNYRVCKFDMVCESSSEVTDSMDPFVVQVFLKGTLINDRTMNIDLFLEPRAVIENLFPIDISVRSKMPYTFSSAAQESELDSDVAHDLKPGSRVEVFTEGDALAIAMKPTHTPSAGSALDWMEQVLPLQSESRSPEPVVCYFPFAGSKKRTSEFFIAEGYEGLDQLSEIMADEVPKKSDPKSSVREVSLEDPLRSFHATVCCYGVDHTGEVLFDLLESSKDRKQYHPFGAFSSEGDSSRLTMLPTTNGMRLLQTSSEEEDGYKATLPFTMNDLVIGEGGVNALPILWENKKSSGYCAYRRLVNEHQSEIHIVPEFAVFNGSAEAVIISEQGMEDIRIEAGSFAPLKCVSRAGGLELALSYVKEECKTRYIRVDQLGVKMELVQSTAGTPVGSVCVQTALDSYGNARLVVKIGDITAGGKAAIASSVLPAFLADDFVRLRVRWTELQLVLNESQEKQRAEGLTSQNDISFANHTDKNRPKPSEPGSVMSVNVSGLNVDVQRLFEEKGEEDGDQKVKTSSMSSPERCEVSMIVHQLQVKDLTPESSFPVVFNSSSDVHLIDLSAKTRGPIGAEIVKVDVFDLSLSHSKGKSEMIQLTTSEEYVWRIVDMMTRISEASNEVGDYSLDQEGYLVESSKVERVSYTPPRVDQLYELDLTRVSPFALLVSFRRTPDESRYEMAQNVRGAALTNYFTRKLKFSIDKAKLKFGKYENKSLKGPPDRLLESLGAVYVGRMKYKVLTLLSSASLQDWQFLAAREGEDAFVEGDEFRATGNIAGMAAGALVGSVGRGLGDGVSGVTRTFGKGIEEATGLVGARKLGAGVNTVISGVGGGVGNTLTGVTGGAGKVVAGAGQGVGQVVGGVLGGVFQIGKGIGTGIVKGDGKAMVNGIGKGAGQIGGGAVHGTGSVFKGAKDGVLRGFGKKNHDKN
ncbi:unnamed protein product [Cylindrotheca closterium]|uniref:Chorein N-terminal domain-containing protein n=1 Tax=Cylindrotheca closterium TaxID=2856 RepID=A0AAD2FF65_9STRA|nr:unnamed protein product [Cylindrotheca closterium]